MRKKRYGLIFGAQCASSGTLRQSRRPDRIELDLSGEGRWCVPRGMPNKGGGRMTEQDEQRGDGEIGVCHVCGQAFDTQLALSKHLMDVHEDDLLPDGSP